MIMKYSFLVVAALALSFSSPAQKVDLSGELHAGSAYGKPAPEWQEMLRREHGWLGADGVYAVAMNGVEASGSADTTTTLIWFSDSIFGDIINDSLKNWSMVNNSVAYLKGGQPSGDKIEFYSRLDEKGNRLSVFEAHTPNSKPGEYYWLGDGFFNHATDSTIYIFAHKIINVPGGPFPFAQTGVSLIAIPKGDKFPFLKQRQMDTPLFSQTATSSTFYGASVMANTNGARTPRPDGFIYIYGVQNPGGKLLVARVKDSDFEDFNSWTFWNGKEWDKEQKNARHLIEHVSNEMSVSFLDDGRVVAIYQKDGNSPYTMMQVGDGPAGPFYPAKVIYETPEIYQDIDFYTYNAKAFPHLSPKGKILISYNVNAFNFEKKIEMYPQHLRPRFITIEYR